MPRVAPLSNFGAPRMMAAVVALAIGVMASAPAEAGLIGKQLDAVYAYPDASTPYANASFTPLAFVVGAGQETEGLVEDVTRLLVDFSDSALTITLRTVLTSPTWNATSFNGIVFTATSPLGLSGASVDALTTMSGFDDSRVSVTSNQILVNWNGLGYVDGTLVKVGFASSPAAVSTPSTLALLVGGLLGIGVVGRRRFA